MSETTTFDDGTELETFDHADVPDDAPDPDAWRIQPLREVREWMDADDDPDQLDRIEAKLDAMLAGADALREATEPLMHTMANGGLMGMLGGMLGGR